MTSASGFEVKSYHGEQANGCCVDELLEELDVMMGRMLNRTKETEQRKDQIAQIAYLFITTPYPIS